jgi:hypothetical protein
MDIYGHSFGYICILLGAAFGVKYQITKGVIKKRFFNNAF